MNTKINNLFDFRKHVSYLIGVDIGTHSLKVVGLKMGGRQLLSFCSIAELPSEHGAKEETELLKKILKDNNVSLKDTVLTFSGDTVAFRRAEIPSLPLAEITDALRWQEKDVFPFNAEDAYIAFELLEETQKEDGSKAMSFIFVAAAKEAMDNKVEAARSAGLKVMSVSMAPFGMENVLRLDQQMDKGKSVAVVDIGFKKTEVSIFRNNILQFVRHIPVGSEDITESMQRPISSNGDEIRLSRERAEAIKKSIGISYEESVIDEGVSSIQVLSLMRPILEQILKEIRRSIDYYLQEYGKKDEGMEIRLIGGGALLKNLDRYLGEELGVSVKLTELPRTVDVTRSDFKSSDSPLIAGLIGVMLGYRDKINLLPNKYETEKFESFGRMAVNAVSFIFTLILAGAFLLLRNETNDYRKKLNSLPYTVKDLVSVKDFQAKMAEREAFLSKISESDISIERVMKSLSNLIPKNIVLSSLSINTNTKTLDMNGTLYGPRSETEKILTKLTEDMEKSQEFRDAQVGSMQTQEKDQSGTESSAFTISCLMI